MKQCYAAGTGVCSRHAATEIGVAGFEPTTSCAQGELLYQAELNPVTLSLSPAAISELSKRRRIQNPSQGIRPNRPFRTSRPGDPEAND